MNSSKRILVVDDEPDAIEFVDAVLSELSGLNIIPAYDGDKVVSDSLANPPDLIILDVMMPKKDGFKVFYELKKEVKTREIPVIILTGVADKAGIRFFQKDLKDYLGSEPADYIEKPLDPDRLKASVKKALNL